MLSDSRPTAAEYFKQLEAELAKKFNPENALDNIMMRARVREIARDFDSMNPKKKQAIMDVFEIIDWDK